MNARIYGFKKIDLKTMADEPEEIYVEDICYYYSVRSRPVVCLHDGRKYFLVDSFESYKKVLESLDNFQTIDRCCSVKLNTVEYYNKEKNSLHFNDKVPDVLVARKYKNLIMKLVRKLGIKIKS